MDNEEIKWFLSRFHKTVETWISFLDQYTLEMLHRKPNDTAWSLGQVYSHIIEETEYYMGEMKSALATEENSGKTMHEDGRSMFENDEFPNQQLINPSNDPDIRQPENKETLLRQLTGLRDSIDSLFQNYDREKNQGKTAHPGLHYFSALEWLRFAEMHMRHHLRQKERIDSILFSAS